MTIYSIVANLRLDLEGDVLDSQQIGSLEIARYVALVRERAGIKQAELARRVTLSPAVLSRIESGDRPLDPDELKTILEAIGSDEALSVSEFLLREWTVLPRPPLDHPDRELLWNAENTAKKLKELRDSPNVRSAFERRLSEFIDQFSESSALILKREHQIAFVGSIGIGKSTAICRLTGLEVPGKDGGPSVPVLEAGAGGITLCEVHLQSGPEYGLLIEPRTEEEIRADVTDFAEHLRSTNRQSIDDQDADAESHGISKETERAIRNMSGLKIRREKGADGKTSRHDEAKELALRFGTLRELVVEILARMQLHRRDRRDCWYESNSGKPPLVWLKECFEEINNGRHQEVALPKRIEVVIPEALLPGTDLSVRMIDTKGIDRTAARADLENHLDDLHTLSILCSGFNNAPSAEARLLLERAKESGVRTLQLNTALLVLPRPTEAMAVKDESGVRVESDSEGYELKGEQISLGLEPLQLAQLPVSFFNSHQDNPEGLQSFLLSRLQSVRQSFRDRLASLIKDAEQLLVNSQQEQTKEILRSAAKMLESWIAQNTALPALNARVQDSLMDQFGRVYASTVRATVRREGEWPNLSYSHHLGYGARRVAAMAIGPYVEAFSTLCATLVGNEDFKEACDLVRQADRVLNSSYEELLRRAQLMGQGLYLDQLKPDSKFWIACEQEWGRGPGYRDRVLDHNNNWFKLEKTMKQELQTLMEREWSQGLSSVKALFDS